VRDGVSAVAPDKPECVPLFSVALGDVSSLAFRGAEPPDTALAFSPDGKWLAIGAYTGELIVVDAWTGMEKARRVLPEALVKSVGWSPDGTRVYAGEQSAEAKLHALDASDLKELWSVSLADDVGRSPPPAGDDLYGVYTLPSVLGLEIVDGEILVTAAHGWMEGEVRRNASKMVRFSPEGRRVAEWPESAPLDGTLFRPRVFDGETAVQLGRSATGPAPGGVPFGSVAIFDFQLKMKRTLPVEPLLPWFPSVFVWDALDLRGDRGLVGTGDGRVFLWEGEHRLRVDLGTPVAPDGVPLASSIGFGRLTAEGALVATSETSIPYGAADPAWRPPAPHPSANALWFYGKEAELQWTWRGPHQLQGTTVSPDGRETVVGAGPRTTDERTDLFGALIFRLEGEGSGEDRLRCFCSTASPVFFRQAWSHDGRIAVTEHPYRAGDQVRGTYQVTVFR